MPNLNIRVAPSLSEAFAEVCEKRGTTVSDALRRFMEYAVEHANERDWLARTEPVEVGARPETQPLVRSPRLAPRGLRGFTTDGVPITQASVTEGLRKRVVMPPK